jgi:hypothetical protein
MAKRRAKRHPVEQPVNESFRYIPLTRGLNAIVDLSDFDWLNERNWCAFIPEPKRDKNVVYAVARIDGKFVYMHRLIAQCSAGEEADHINHNTLDNRRANLRKCTSANNKWNLRKGKQNSSGFKGVSWDKSRNQWSAKISLGDRTVNIGRFPTANEAARAYDEKAVQLFGKFAHTNFPTEHV